MSDFYTLELTEAERHRLWEAIVNKTDISGGCHTWTGSVDRYGYGRLVISVRNKKRYLSVHRLVYFLFSNIVPLKPHMQVSHRCHKRSCINLNHLSYESAALNRKRTECKQNGYWYVLETIYF